MSDPIKATILVLDPDRDFLEAASRLNPHPDVRVIAEHFSPRDKSNLASLIQASYPDVVVINLDIDNELDFGNPILEIHDIPLAFSPLILGTSARDALALKQRAYKLGIDDLLLRPFNPVELWLRLEALLRIRRLQRQIDAASRNLSLLNTKLSATNRRLEQMTLTDELTGLSNMRYMDKFLENQFLILRRHARPFCILMMDLDHFKQVNDKNDHLVGSNTIRDVGHTIERIMRKMDVKARYGGDEYIIAMPETDEAGGKLGAERLRLAIAEQVFPGSEGGTFKITSSMGLAAFDIQRHVSYKDLIKDADYALYDAKRKGRNQVSFYVHGQTQMTTDEPENDSDR